MPQKVFRPHHSSCTMDSSPRVSPDMALGGQTDLEASLRANHPLTVGVGSAQLPRTPPSLLPSECKAQRPREQPPRENARC